MPAKRLLNEIRTDTHEMGRRLLQRARLADFYVIWKLYKKANTQGVRSHPISNNIGYPTGQASHFLHRQLIDAVNAHTHVLKHSLSLIRQLESLVILALSSDIAALYPWIKIEDGMKTLQWFKAQHSSTPLHLQPKSLKLVRFDLGNNLFECKGIRLGLVSAEHQHSDEHILFG